MKTEDKERIEKDAKRYLLQTYGGNYPDAEKAYIAGATAEREHMAEQLHRYKNAMEIKDRQLKQERNKAIDVQKILTNSEGSNHLKWIYDRMIYVLGENPNMDYMHKFKSIIEKLTARGEHKTR